MNSYILESDRITGPYRLVTYRRDFGEQGYFLNFPSKFVSEDGRTAWLCYSSNYTSTVPNASEVFGVNLEEDPLWSGSAGSLAARSADAEANRTAQEIARFRRSESV